jgi:hypothetical protein
VLVFNTLTDGFVLAMAAAAAALLGATAMPWADWPVMLFGVAVLPEATNMLLVLFCLAGRFMMSLLPTAAMVTSDGTVLPQQVEKGTICSMLTRHWTHFFINAAQLSQAHIWPQGWKSTDAFLSEQTTHSSILDLDCTTSLQMRHFLTLGEQIEHVAMCQQGPNRVSRFMSEHTIQSS